jgi:phosphate transport system substrate-binding protein
MSNKSTWVLPTYILGAALALTIFGCSGGSGANNEPTPSATTGGEAPKTGSKLSGELKIDGSTTVYPIVSVLSEDFTKANADVKATVGKAGTGSGMKKFIAGEVDIATASRSIKDDEVKSLAEKKIDFIEIPVAYDGVSIIVNPGNTWASDVTPEELKKAWAKDSTVTTWDQINAKFPKEKITFYGPTDNHGTYEYFTEAINGKKNEIRKEYQPNQEYTAIVSAVAGDKGGMAFVGYNYYADAKDKVKALTVSGVGPEEKTIADGTYKPLSRPLFIYVNKTSMDTKPQVKAFVEFALGDKGKDAVKEAHYVLLGDDVMKLIKDHVAAGTAGTMMKDFKPGMKLSDVYAKK